MLRRAGIAAAVLLAGVPLFARQPPSPSAPSSSSQPSSTAPSPTFKLGVNYIEVDALVTDKQGNFVRGLTKNDFKIFEDGNPQTISAFSVVDMPTVPSEPARQPLAESSGIQSDVASNAKAFEGRLYVMVIDDLHTKPGQAQHTRDVARRFVEQDLGPHDLMAIVHTVGALTASETLTSNKPLLLAAIDKTGGNGMGSAAIDVQRGDSGYSVDQRETAGALAAYQTLQTVANWLGKNVQNRRKAILFVSDGVAYDIRNVVPNDAQIAEENMASPGANVPTHENAAAVLEAQKAAFDAARANNVTVYGIDPRGLADKAASDIEEDNPPPVDTATGPHPAGALSDEVRLAQDSLRTVAGQTGGFAIVDNNFNAGYQRIVAENSSYYVLAYYPGVERHDGKFHKIEVRVDRPGVTVNARKGYFAPKLPKASDPSTASSDNSTDIDRALRSPIAVSGLTLHVFAAPFKGESSTSSVLLVTELSGADLALTPGDKIDVGYVALDAAGHTRAGHTNAITLNVQPTTKTRIQESGVRLLNRLSLPPGHYQLRVAAEDEAGGRVGSVVDTLDVPDFTKTPLALSGIVLTSPSASFMVTAQPDPALQPVMPGPPAALRSFPQTDTVAVYAEAYNHEATSAGAVTMSATVTDGAGKVEFTSAGAPASAPQADPAKTSFAVQIPMKDLPPGFYVLTVTARSQASNVPPATRQVPFTIVSVPPHTPAAAVAPASPGERATEAAAIPTPAILGPCCPNEQSYETAVRGFAHGDRGAALMAIARAPADQVKRAVDHLDDDDEQLLEAASVMHLVVGMRAIEAGYLPQVTLHLGASNTVFQKIRPADATAFSGTWYLAATELYLAIGDLDAATAMVQRAIHEDVEQGNARLVEGIINETEAEIESRTLEDDSDRTKNRPPPESLHLRFDARQGFAASENFYQQTSRARRSFELGQAETAYRHVLEKDPASEEARLRLGRVLSLEGKAAEARTTLENVAGVSRDQRVLYLAHLFLADLAIQQTNAAVATRYPTVDALRKALKAIQTNAAAAIREYQAAIAANPTSRIAYIGLSNLALLAGDEPRAQEYIRDWGLRNAAPPDTAWMQYERGIDQLEPTLNALLRMIAR